MPYGDPDQQREYIAEREVRVRGAHSTVEVEPPADPARRAACAGDLRLFMTTYLPVTFYTAFAPHHLREIERMERVCLSGGRAAIADPRGDGKSSRCKAAALWAILYGHVSYLVYLAATAELAKDRLDEIKGVLHSSDLLHEDFPEITAFVRHCQGRPQAAKSRLYDGQPAFFEWSAGGVVFPTVPEPWTQCSGAALEAVSVTGAVKGRSRTRADGVVMRPSLVVIDDAQKTESALSPPQCDRYEKLVQSDVLGMAGPGQAMAAFMPCTIVAPGDLASRFTDRKKHPEWGGEINAMIISWPTAEDLWEEYRQIRHHELEELEHTYPTDARKFYEDHREAMDAGAEVSWPERKLPQDASAIQHAMNLFYELGDSFFSEYQNAPKLLRPALYELTPEMVASRVNGRKVRSAPAAVRFVVAMIDVNDAGLHWAVCGFGNDLTGYVLEYGKFPEGRARLWSPEHKAGLTEQQAIYKGLDGLTHALMDGRQWTRDDGPVRPGLITVDCGYEMSTVFSFTGQAQFPCKVIASRGWTAKSYRAAPDSRRIGEPGNNHDMRRFTGRQESVIVHNADYWRHYVQRAFLLPVGAPGSISLWGEDPSVHLPFAEQVASMKLVQYQEGDKYTDYGWQRVPGREDHWLDALVGCCVAASQSGASMPGTRRLRRKPQPAPAPRVTYSPYFQ